MLNFNGTIQAEDTTFLDPQNRGLKYGDALFETMRATNSVIFFLEDHYLRLMASMRILRMEIPMDFTMEFLEAQIKETLKANQLANKAARIRFTIFRNSGGRYLPNSNSISFIVECNTLKSPFYVSENTPYEVELYKDFYIHADMLSNLKTNNRIINVVGSIYAEENDYDNCILLNHNKLVVEALNANLFLVRANRIITPPLKDGCINGILRKQLIEILKKEAAYSIEEVSISPFDLQKAEELFITNTIIGIQSITKYRKAEFKGDTATILLGKLNSRIKEMAN